MLWILIFLGAAVLVWAVSIFNRLVGLRNRAKGSWSDIDVQLKRRHDLVGNLVRTVQGYAAHERETLQRVVEARTRAESAREGGRPAEAGDAERNLVGGLNALLAVVEGYPDLKASDGFLELQRGLTEVEDDLQNARRYYNAVVRDLNTRIQSVPDLVIARPFGFHEWEFFQLDDPSEAAVPRVAMGSDR
jgi:LemA protein